MSYVQGTDFISNTEECRRLARNVVVADFDTDQIKSYQYKHYSTIRTLTDKDDWDSADREFGSLQLVETELTAASIIKHYGNPEDASVVNAWISIKESAMKDLDKIVDNMDTEPETSEVEVDIGRTEYKGWGLNTSLEPPNRRGSHSTNTEGF